MKSEQFAIGFADRAENDRRNVTGYIHIGEFSEHFPVAIGYWDRATYLRHWREALARLAAGSSAVGLLTWMIPPGSSDHARAWILYRDGERVIVQERLFIGQESRPAFDEHGHLRGIEPRTTSSDDGAPISEWTTNVSSIQDFLTNDRNA